MLVPVENKKMEKIYQAEQKFLIGNERSVAMYDFGCQLSHADG
jgi:hypothetical protein